jgi:triacylglycerol lipase
MVGVNVERRHWRGTAWDAGARDIGAAIQWVRRNIASRGGDPNRIIFIGHAYGGTTLATYLAHPELQGPDGVGLSAAVLIGAPFNLAPANAIAPAAGNPMFDPAHSNLQGMKALRIPVFLGVGELETADALSSATVLRDQLCGAGRCPSYRAFPDHGHISVMFSFNTADRSVSGPVLDWMRNLR